MKLREFMTLSAARQRHGRFLPARNEGCPAVRRKASLRQASGLLSTPKRMQSYFWRAV
jgi:hypothetical protein